MIALSATVIKSSRDHRSRALRTHLCSAETDVAKGITQLARRDDP